MTTCSGSGRTAAPRTATPNPKETDHGTDWANLGATSARNMNGMCKHTHFLKTADNFTITNNPDQSTTWTTPAGNSYTKPPDDLRITDYGRRPEKRNSP